jgi:hypothetical protein
VSTADMWTYRETMTPGSDLSGFDVEASDGGIGNIDEATYDVGSSFIVVDTGPWIFGKKVMLPAGVINTVDYDDRKVFVNRTKDQIKNAPEFDDDMLRDDSYRSSLGTYYGPGGPGFGDSGSTY